MNFKNTAVFFVIANLLCYAKKNWSLLLQRIRDFRHDAQLSTVCPNFNSPTEQL